MITKAKSKSKSRLRRKSKQKQEEKRMVHVASVSPTFLLFLAMKSRP